VYMLLLSSGYTNKLSITWHWGTFVQPLLQWISDMCYIFWVCVCSLKHLACNAHASYFQLLFAKLYNVFPHYLINSTIFEKKITDHKMVCFDFLYKVCLKYFSL